VPAAGDSAGTPRAAAAPAEAGAPGSGAAEANADARADSFDRTPTDCITLSNVKETAAVDDSTILFYMRGSKKVTYRSSLPLTCPNLAREGRFSYRTQMNRLCDSDVITVLEQFGVGLRDGFTCRLGSFYPIPYEEAELLRKEHDKPSSTRNAMKSKPAELPPKSEPQPAAPSEQAAPSDSAPR
jgi:hypothetical protein